MKVTIISVPETNLNGIVKPAGFYLDVKYKHFTFHIEVVENNGLNLFYEPNYQRSNKNLETLAKEVYDLDRAYEALALAEMKDDDWLHDDCPF